MSRLRSETHVWPRPRAAGVSQAPVGLRAVVIGGGIAGATAATILVERGVEVTLLERERFLGGRAGAWTETGAGGESFEMERGFHAFFRNYYNLRAWLRRIDPELSLLQPLDDYPVLGPNGMEQSFKKLPTTPPFQVMALARRTPHLRLAEMMDVNKRAALEMLAFDMRRTFDRYDDVSARDYLDSLAFPERARRMLFDVFSHSFFNAESEMSAAELLMMFHVYFAGNPEGLVFDVARQPFSTAIWEPARRWLGERGVSIATGTCARRIERGPRRWRVVHDEGAVDAELVVLALDVPGLKQLVAASPALTAEGELGTRVESLGVTRPFAVWRLWLDRPVRNDRAGFAGTAGLGLLDNISIYEKLEDESAAWARRHGGSVVELHGYAVPPSLSEPAIKRALLAGLHHLYPETRAARVVHERFLYAADCPSFPPGAGATRPTVDTTLDGLALCGDFVELPVPAALMERAATSGMLAANVLLAPHGVRPEPVRSVPRRGLFAPPGFARTAGKNDGAGARRVWSLGAALPPRRSRGRERPDWAQASPAWIHRALAHAQALPSGGWFVAGATRSFGERPRRVRIAGTSLVIWRANGRLCAAPDACPHLGASLSEGHVRDGCLVCPWHGLALGNRRHGAWRPLVSHDDGVLFWVRLDDGDEPLTDAPFACERPRRFVDSVLRTEARCEPRDVIQNRLDPWHGVHYHPHTFRRLRVIEQGDRDITVRVAYHVAGPACVEVDARFHCVDPRTIVMTIVAGEGTGSVVETHATPIDAGRTAVIEATLASSQRTGFRLASLASFALRPLIRRVARRLWREDAAYAERLYELRHG